MKTKKLHLSLLMFFQLTVIGAYMPILSIYFRDYIGLTGFQAGIILSMSAIPSILSPFISAWIVDRVITSRRFLALSHIISAILITFLSFQTSYPVVLITYLIYTIFQVPTAALVNALVFHNMVDRNSFGAIRLWGTVGWVAAGWIVSLTWKFMPGLENMPIALRLSALFSLIVVFLTLKLPRLKLDKDKKVSIFPHEAIEVVKKPEVLLLFLLVFIIATADKYLGYGMPFFLSKNGIAQDKMMILLSLGQFSEIILLLTLSKFIMKWGFKNLFLIGLSAEILRFFLFWIDGPLIFTIAGIAIHGVIYAFFYAAASIYLDHFSDDISRGGAHQLFSLTYVGGAGLLGNIFAGYCADHFMIDGIINFKIFWLIPGLASLVTIIILALRMKRISRHDLP